MVAALPSSAQICPRDFLGKDHKGDGDAYDVELRSQIQRRTKRAIVAVGHSLLLTVYAVLQTGKPYSEPDSPPLPQPKRLKKAQDLCRKIQQLGFDIALKEKKQTA